MPLWQHMLVGRRMFDLFGDDGAAVVDAGADGRCVHERSGYLDPGAARRRGAAADPARLAAAPPSGRHRPAGQRGPAAGDHVHLQPGRLRRGGAAVRARRAVADHRRRARRRSTRSSTSDRRASRPRTSTCSGTGTGARACAAASPRTTPGWSRRSRRPSRNCSSRGLVKRGVRHRDPGAGHQHAGPHRRPRAAVEVQRRDARRRDAGGVHAADRARRAARHRHRGPRGRRCGVPRSTRGGSPGWRRPAPIRCARRSVRPTTWRSTWSARWAGPRRRATARVVVRAVPGRPRGGRPGQADPAQRGDPARVRAGRCSATRRLRRVRGAAPRAERAGGRLPGEGRAAPGGGRGVAGEAAPRRRDPRAAGRRAGLAVVLDPGVHPRDDPRPLVVTEGALVRAAVAGRLPGAVDVLGRSRVPKHVNHRSPQERRDLASSMRALDLPAGRHGRAAQVGRRGRGRRGAAAAGASCARIPATPAPTASSTRGGASARPADPRERRAAPPHRGPDRIARAHLRPHLPAARRARLPGRRTRPRRPVASSPGSGRRPTSSSPSACAPAPGTAWTPAELAAVVSTLVYEPRRDETAGRRDAHPGRARRTGHHRADLGGPRRGRGRLGLPPSREPQLGFVWAMLPLGAAGAPRPGPASPPPSAGPNCRPATSSAGASSCSTCSTRSPPRPARSGMARRSRRRPGPPSAAIRRGVVAQSMQPLIVSGTARPCRLLPSSAIGSSVI